MTIEAAPYGDYGANGANLTTVNARLTGTEKAALGSIFRAFRALLAIDRASSNKGEARLGGFPDADTLHPALRDQITAEITYIGTELTK